MIYHTLPASLTTGLVLPASDGKGAQVNLKSAAKDAIRKWIGDTPRSADEIALPPASGRFVADDAEKIAVVAIIKDEADYLGEWLDFHLMAGVDRFCLYDNGEPGKHEAVLRNYEGVVTCIPWVSFHEGLRAQQLAYAHAACNAAQDIRWLIYIDADEFLFSEVYPSIKPAFSSGPGVGALIIPRFEYGPGGHQTQPVGSVVDSYLHRLPVSRHRKAAVDRSKVTAVGVHTSRAEGGRLSSKPNDQGLLPLRVNHYVTKSVQEFNARIDRGWWDLPEKREGKRQKLEEFGEAVEDTAILQFRDRACAAHAGVRRS
jgi:hypothetical protein